MKPTYALALAVPLLAFAVPPLVTAPDGEARIAAAAQAFLGALSAEQRAAANLPFDDEQRRDWHYIPRDNRGLAFRDMSDELKPLAHAMLRSTLSSAGYHKTTTIMFLDQILHELETARGRTAANRDPGRYWIAIFGTPAADASWGWRIQGHHVSLNFSSMQNQLTVASPAFFGANPHEVRSGPYAGLRALGEEEDLGRGLLASLSAEQRGRAILDGEVPRDVVLSPGREADLLGAPKGLPASAMDAGQRAKLWSLIEEYARNLRRELADPTLARIRDAGVDKVHFGWLGSAEPGQPHYYRVHGPTFVIEYDNVQNRANHSHTVWRDLEKDFGEDLLLKHYQEHPLPHDHR